MPGTEATEAQLRHLREENARLHTAYSQTLQQMAAWMEQVNALQEKMQNMQKMAGERT
jgi:hypothetical protein